MKDFGEYSFRSYKWKPESLKLFMAYRVPVVVSVQ